jgi:predicted membrane-bound mannosyltransferase/sugar lactone lactonase YvrE
MTDESAAKNESSLKPWRNLDQNILQLFPLNMENFLAVILLILAVVTRLYGLGDRAASHDEVNHFVPSYDFSQGAQFRFDPMTHGPLQMHLIALSFVALGDSDFTARLPAALFSIATVAIALFLFRRYLGRNGALVAGVLFLISPYMLYYGRYQRNEAFIVVWVLLTMYAILRYLEHGEWRILILFTVVNALHFTDKATGFIFAGGQMVFLVGLFLVRLWMRQDVKQITKLRFLVSLGVSAFLFGCTAYMWRIASGTFTQNPEPLIFLPSIVVGAFGLAVAIVGIVLLMQDSGAVVRAERSSDLIVLLGTLVLPLTAAVWMVTVGKLFGVTQPIDMNFSFLSNIGDVLTSKIFFESLIYILIPTAAAIGIGLWWRPREWWKLALVFFGIFTFFFTTMFTTAGGLMDGLVRFLGYWIVQHADARGGQPWFYYLFIQIPIYEYLPAIGAVVAFFIALRRRLWNAAPGKPFQAAAPETGEAQPVPTISLFLFWALFSLAIFSYAGEKMPQQTMLISAPMILAAAWAVGYLLDTKTAGELFQIRQWKFEIPINVTQSARNILLAAFVVLGVLTARTAYFATYINYDYPNEYMAYAHGAPGPKIAFKEIERLSYLTTGGTDMVVAYDNYVRYPYWWYLRHYKNKIDFDVNPGMEIRQAAIVVVGEQNNSKVIPILGEDYVSFQQMRMWWHNEDYFKLKWDWIETEYLSDEREKGVELPPPMTTSEYMKRFWGHVGPIFLDPQTRAAAFQIWLNRDFTTWGELVSPGGGYTYQDWSLSERLYIYFRKDLLDYLGGSLEGTSGAGLAYDPYALSRIDLIPDFTTGQNGSAPGQFLAPRGIAVASDGSMYVADSMNHRIQHLDSNGNVIAQWGTYANVDQGNAPGGTFNEPWGIGLGPDGSVYVADTWNHRVQKFTANGDFITMWGSPPSDTTAEISFYGPRTIAVNAQGQVFVADTGNKRIMVFTSDGDFITQFGTPGAGEGQLDEPVGLAVDDQGQVFVADTWNRRVQIFAPGPDGTYSSVGMWEVNAWYGTTSEIKPFLALDSNHHVYLTDPSTCRILEFTERGVILRVWGTCGDDDLSLNSPTGIAIDPLGGLWVSDSRHDRLVHYTVPG